MELPRANPTERGTVEFVQFQPSANLVVGGYTHLGVYLPPCYDPYRNEPYPVVYLSHGMGGDQTDWFWVGGAHNIMDNLIAAGYTEPTVMVSMNQYQLGTMGGNMVVAINNQMNNIMPFIEENFNVSSDPRGRAFAGLSQGGALAVRMYAANAAEFGYWGFLSTLNMGIGPIVNENIPNRNIPTIFAGHGIFEGGIFTALPSQLTAAGIDHVFYTVPTNHDQHAWSQLFTIFARDYLWQTEWPATDFFNLVVAVVSANTRNAANYTATSWARVEDARTAALAVLRNLDARQAEVNAATASLNAALNALALLPPGPPGVTINEDPSSPTGLAATFVFRSEANATRVVLAGDLTLRDVNDPLTPTVRYQPEQWQQGRYHAGGIEFRRDMINLGEGYWTITLPLHAGGLSYWYRVWDDNTLPQHAGVNQGTRVYDPASTHVRPTGTTTFRANNNDVLDVVFVPYHTTMTDPLLETRAQYEMPRTNPVERGTVKYVEYTTVLGNTGWYLGVYLPPCYDPYRDEPYNVIYMLHGVFGDETDWMIPGNVPTILDNMIARNEVEPFVVITIGNHFSPGGGMASYNQANSARNLVETVLPFVEDQFNVSTERAGRAFAGFSMGAMTGGHVLNNSHDLFSYFGMIAGNPTAPNFAGIVDEADGTLPTVFIGFGTFEGQMTQNNLNNRYQDFVNHGFPTMRHTVPGGHDMMAAGLLFTIFARDYLWQTEWPATDFSHLMAAVLAANTRAAANYTYTSWARVAEARATALAILRHMVAGQREVDAATASLHAALDALELIPSGPLYFTVTFNLAGGTRTGGGELVQHVRAGESAVAPIITPAQGYRFVRWSNAFTSITGNLTVTAEWEQVLTQAPDHAINVSVGSDGNVSVVVQPDGVDYAVDVDSNGNIVITLPNADDGGDVTANLPSGWTSTPGINGGSVTIVLTPPAGYEVVEYPAGSGNLILQPVREFHSAYMIGSAAGFRPRANITRAEVATILARTHIEGFEAGTLPEGMTDVPFGDTATHWARFYIAWAFDADLVRGDGINFRPNDFITRQELAAILARTGTVRSAGTTSFGDAGAISGWASNYVYTVYREGFMIGDQRSNFRPQANITRAEVATAVNRMLGRIDSRDALAALGGVVQINHARSFPDVSESAWYFASVLAATNDHYLTRVADGTVNWMKITDR